MIHIGIASIAPDVATVAVHIHATSGAVTAALTDRRNAALLSDGGDFMPATLPPARLGSCRRLRDSGQGPRRLVLADPGPLDATVTLRLVTRSGLVHPGWAQPGRRPRRPHPRDDLGQGRSAVTTGAVVLTSDQPVIAAGMSRSSQPPHRPDLMWLAATDPLVGSAGVATGREPDGGQCLLLLTAPQGAAAGTGQHADRANHDDLGTGRTQRRRRHHRHVRETGRKPV